MISFLTYFGGSVQLAIWMGKPWSAVGKDLLDSLIFGTKFSTVMWVAEPCLLVAVCIAWGALLTVAVEHPANRWLRRKLLPRRA